MRACVRVFVCVLLVSLFCLGFVVVLLLFPTPVIPHEQQEVQTSSSFHALVSLMNLKTSETVDSQAMESSGNHRYSQFEAVRKRPKSGQHV